MKLVALKQCLSSLLFSAFLFLTFSPAFTQYKLELEWQKEIGGSNYSIMGLLVYDSLLLVTGGSYSAGEFRVYHYDTNGNLIKIMPCNHLLGKLQKTNNENEFFAYNSNKQLGIINKNSLEEIYWIKESDDFTGATFQKTQNKIISYGETFIRIYDINKKEMVRDYKLGGADNSKLSDNGKYIVYTTSYQNGPLPGYRMSIIDTSGKEIKFFPEVSSSNFAFTIDGKNLIYFDKDATYLLNLETMQDNAIIPNEISGYGHNPSCIEVSSDGKYIFTGGGGLDFFDFENRKRTLLNQLGGFNNFKLNTPYSSVYTSSGETLYKLNLKPTTSVEANEINLAFKLQTNQNTLIISSQSILNPNLQFSIVGIDGKQLHQIQPNEIQINNNSTSIDISSLSTGTYLLQVSSSDAVVFSSKFIKVD